MPRRILKYAVPDYGRGDLVLDGFVRVVHVGEQSPGQVTVWVETEAPADGIADPKDIPAMRCRFRIFATGDTIDRAWRPVGSVITALGLSVWHVYVQDGRM
jgi:hypothetical protein